MASTHLEPHSVGFCPRSTPSQCQPHRNVTQQISILVPRMNHTGPHLGYILYLQADSGRINILTSYFHLYSIIPMLLNPQLSCASLLSLICVTRPSFPCSPIKL